MSKEDFGLSRRIPVDRRTITNPRLARPSPSPSPTSSSSSGRKHRRRNSSRRITRSLSQPSLRNVPAESEPSKTEVEEVLARQRTCSDIFSSPANRAPVRGTKRGFDKDAKVLVNVTVEGSPGPVRAIVRLGATVDEMISTVLERYREEGRTPPLEKDAATTCGLHHSKFTLESLSRSDLIGDLGRRTFYLHRSIEDKAAQTSENSSPLPFPSFISQLLRNSIQQSKCFQKVFGCLLASS